MKKAITLLLCLLMVTSLVACGNNNTATDDSQTSQVETENNETSTSEESEETPTEAETETPVESEEPTEESVLSFDTSWTSNTAAQNVPEPPVEYAISEKMSSDTFCFIEITYATCDEIVAYCDLLQSCGFSIDVSADKSTTDDGRTIYNFKAKNDSGVTVSLDFSEMEDDYTLTYFQIEVS